MDVRQARIDAQAGRLSVEALLDLLDQQEQTIQRLTAEVQRLRQRLAQYEPEVQREATPPKPTPSPLRPPTASTPKKSAAGARSGGARSLRAAGRRS
jgi:uncharacterized coiled-coil protein SlyX